MNNIKKHFEDEAKEFDDIIIKLIPYYTQMLTALIDSVPFNEFDTIQIIDLGCGTGNISKIIKTKYPNANIHCVDIAENMIAMAQYKLKNLSGITYEVADLNNYYFKNNYDVVITSLALHHLFADITKKQFYKIIYRTGISIPSPRHNKLARRARITASQRQKSQQDNIEI